MNELRNGYLTERQATNILAYSNNPGAGAPWNLVSVAVSLGVVRSPDGKMNGHKLYETTTSNTDFELYQGQSATTNRAYCASVFLKAAERRRVRLWWVTGAYVDGVLAYVDLVDGVVYSTATVGNGSYHRVRLKEYPDGWYRIELVGQLDYTVATATTGYWVLDILDDNGTATHVGVPGAGVYYFVAQAETPLEMSSTYATSPIVTGAAAVTRPADALSYPYFVLPETEGTVSAEYQADDWFAANTRTDRVIGHRTTYATLLYAPAGNSGAGTFDATTGALGPSGFPAGVIQGSAMWGNATQQAVSNHKAGGTTAYDGGHDLGVLGIGWGKDSDWSGTIGKVEIYAKKISVASEAQFPTPTLQPWAVLDDVNEPNKAWSKNPTLCTADFARSSVYGANKKVDWESVAECADLNDKVVGTALQEVSRQLDIVIDNVSKTEDWLETLRAYASIFISPEGGVLRFVPDSPGEITHSWDSTNIFAVSSLKKRGLMNVPTVMRIMYTDTSKLPYASTPAVDKADGVDAGTTPRRESEVSMPGVTRATQAKREAIERRAKLALCDLSASITVPDIGVKVRVGEIGYFTVPSVGIVNKPMRVLQVDTSTPGEWGLALSEYNEDAYTERVEDATENPDTTLPGPGNPPAVTGLIPTEDKFTTKPGLTQSRIKATWTLSPFQFVQFYQVEMYDPDNKLVFSTNVIGGDTAMSPALKEGITYSVRVRIVSTTGARGAWTTQAVNVVGKTAIPGNVPSITAFEVGGEVRARWEAALTVVGGFTVPDDDVWRYELRYAAVGGTWANGVFIDRVDGFSKDTKIIPSGNWDIMVKAIDSIKQESATEARVTVNVSLDSGSFLADMYSYASPSLTNMAEYSLGRLDKTRRFVTEDGVSCATKFSSALTTYTNPLHTYHSSVSSQFLTETHDFGVANLTGNWNAVITASAISGSFTKAFELSNDNFVTQQSFPVLSAKTGARYSRLRVNSTTGTDTVYCEIPYMTTQVSAVPRSENSTFTSSSGGGVLVELANAYGKAVDIQLTVAGNTLSSSPKYDDVQVFAGSTRAVRQVGTFTASGATYAWSKIANPTRVIASGDYLEFDVYVDPSSPTIVSGLDVGGIDLWFTDSSRTAGAACVDGIACGWVVWTPSVNPRGQWVSRKLSLAAYVGKTCSSIQLGGEPGATTGVYTCYARNIRITDGAGTQRALIWAQGDVDGTLLLSNNTSGVTLKPMNTFRGYSFDKTDTKQNGIIVGYAFKGV